MSIVLRPSLQREAEGVLTMARSLVEARGESLGIPGHLRLRLDHLTIMQHRADESNTLSISNRDETVLYAAWCDDGLPPLFIDYKPDAWRWILRRAAGALSEGLMPESGNMVLASAPVVVPYRLNPPSFGCGAIDNIVLRDVKCSFSGATMKKYALGGIAALRRADGLIESTLLVLVLGVMLFGRVVETAYAQSYLFTDLPNPSGTTVFQPNGINNAGLIIGLSVGSSISDTHGYVYSGGSYTPFDHPLATGANQFTVPAAINNLGQIAGQYVGANGFPGQPFLYSGGTFTNLPNPAGAIGFQPNGINDAGQIIGLSIGNSFELDGFVYSGGTYTPFNHPLATGPNQFTVPGAINDLGQITGQYVGANSITGQPFLYSGGTITNLPNPTGAVGFQPNGINDAGQIIGLSIGSNFELNGYVYSGGTYTPFNHPLAGSGPNQFTVPAAINDLGQIAGLYIDANDVRHAFIATPVVGVPLGNSTWPVMFLGAVTVAFMAYRRRRAA